MDQKIHTKPLLPPTASPQHPGQLRGSITGQTLQAKGLLQTTCSRSCRPLHLPQVQDQVSGRASIGQSLQAKGLWRTVKSQSGALRSRHQA